MSNLVVELYCGSFGWSAGWLALGGQAIGFDIDHQPYHGPIPSGAELVLQDVRTLHGSQFRHASLILASPPCQEFSYRAMPWKRAKALGPPLLGMELFEACFRLQSEACDAAGRYIPMVVENVRGAQKYVGKARWNFGSYYLWGDVPALMPHTLRAQKFNPDGTAHGGGSWFAVADSKNRGARSEGMKNGGGSWFAVSHNNVPHSRGDGTKVGTGRGWFGDATTHPLRTGSSKSSARRAASAAIARIPETLSRHIAETYYDGERVGAA